MKMYEIKYKIIIDIEADNEAQAELKARDVLYDGLKPTSDVFVGYSLLKVDEL